MGKATTYYNSVKAARVEWANSKPAECMACGSKGGFVGLQIHEIERRSHAADAWAHWSNYLLVCQECHDGLFASMPHAKQLAHKWLADKEDFHLMHWLSLRDPMLRAPNRVTMGEVLEWVEVITSEQALGIIK